MKKYLIYLLLTAALFAVFFVPGIKEKISKQFFPVAAIEQSLTVDEAEYDIQLKGINTADTNLKNFRGKKLLFLNYWGTWCAPCRKEWPTIQKLYDAKKNKMDFVLIAMKDQEGDVQKFLKQNNYTVPVYIAESPLPEKILPKAFPTTFILGKDGRIHLKEDYSKEWDNPESQKFIDELAK